MTRFVDTTLRLLSQDPLARTLSSATHPAPRREARRGRVQRARGLGRRLLHDRGRARPGEPVGAHPRGARAHAHAARDGSARHVPGRRPARGGRSRAPLRAVRGRVGHRRLPHARPAQRHRRPGRAGRRRARGRRAPVRGPRLLGRARGPRLPARARAPAVRHGRRPHPAARPRRRARPGDRGRAHPQADRGRRRARRPLRAGAGRHGARRRDRGGASGRRSRSRPRRIPSRC